MWNSKHFFLENFSGHWKNCILLFKTVEYASYAFGALESVFSFCFVFLILSAFSLVVLLPGKLWYFGILVSLIDDFRNGLGEKLREHPEGDWSWRINITHTTMII